MTYTSIIAILISCSAFGFSLYTWREGISRGRRDLFLRLHESLIETEHQKGRRTLYQKVNSVEDARSLFLGNPEDYALANKALAMLDTAALYAERAYIDGGLFMEEWGYTFKNMLKHAEYFMAERKDRNALPNTRPIVHFFAFAEQAANHEWPEQET
jgi:hypothetical protein